jgi:predicted metal-dependent hydrolase
VQFELPFQNKTPLPEVLSTSQPVRVSCVKNPRARRYILRVRRDGTVRVTIPRNGTKKFALDFAERHTAWISKQLQARLSNVPQNWDHGTEFLFQGEPITLLVDNENKEIRFADQVVALREMAANLKPIVQAHLWKLAYQELPSRTLELAALHQISVRRVAVRNQRSRWGSCSAKGTISLNWRLIQTPPFVRDYLIVHELMHLRQMNHSDRFWALVKCACPDYEQAENWLNGHKDLLR